jgi:hypothetical protein
MCVIERGFHWERPATDADIPVVARAFPGIDIASVFKAMSVHGFVPLPTMFGRLLGFRSQE